MQTIINCSHPQDKLKVLWDRTLTVDGFVLTKPSPVCTNCDSVLPATEQPGLGLLNSLTERHWHGNGYRKELSRRFNIETSAR